MSKPLQFSWKYWFCKGVPTEEETKENHLQAYRNCNIQIEHEIATVQDFWVCYLELPKPSQLEEKKQGFILCRNGVNPEWEDPEMKNGGVWNYVVSSKSCDDFWKYALMAAIGQGFVTANLEADEIVAVQNDIQIQGPSNTKTIRIKIWHKRLEKKDFVASRLKELLSSRVPDQSLWAEKSSYHKSCAAPE
ncbi:Eukaryotic translation initiation factor 4E-1 [Diplonema papillatum]|nr:Eukaryotic translation initiation factor 4E-1 [Diplonema papillatum]